MLLGISTLYEVNVLLLCMLLTMSGSSWVGFCTFLFGVKVYVKYIHGNNNRGSYLAGESLIQLRVDNFC